MQKVDSSCVGSDVLLSKYDDSLSQVDVLDNHPYVIENPASPGFLKSVADVWVSYSDDRSESLVHGGNRKFMSKLQYPHDRTTCSVIREAKSKNALSDSSEALPMKASNCLT